MRCRAAFLLIAVSPLLAQTAAGTSEVIAMREHNAALLARLPAFTCVETIDRSVRRPRDKRFRPLEAMRLEVGYAGGEEVHLWPGAAKFESAKLVRRIRDGAISDGDFATHALNIFVRERALIEPAGEDAVLGVRARAFRFRIPGAEDGWTLSNRGFSRPVAAEGHLWADAKSLDLLRIGVSARDIPPVLGIASLDMRIDYAVRGKGSGRVLLPRASQMELDLTNRAENRTTADFGECKEFRSKSALMSWSMFDER